MRLFFLIIILISNLFNNAVGSNPDSAIWNSNKIPDQNIKTVLLHREGWDMSPPIILLNSEEQLQLSFDDLESGVKDYRYNIIHCDYNWEPSVLNPYKYIEGYLEEEIDNYEFSRNTLVSYTHYSATIPGENMQIKLSGNFMLQVYTDSPENIVFTRQFKVVEQLVDIDINVKQDTDVAEKNFRQEVDFSVSTHSIKIDNPYRNLKVCITQNNRTDNRITNLSPKMIVGDNISYDLERENVFEGGNEFRNFDIRDLFAISERINKVDSDFENYYVELKKDEKRSFQVYKTIDDLNGKFKIERNGSEYPETDGEYANITFFLPYNAPLIDGSIHIIGALTDWRTDSTSRMEYNFKQKRYEKTLLLKQGYYNYLYILNSEYSGKTETGFIEGNHSETENDYSVYVYYFDPAYNCDLLIGVKHINTATE
ncbi:MAG: DUF5103 domain-containing protein [Bacteroidales bacterium]|nr:DUF5103 domain-containing protein [Bacteroidales bacterium]